MHVLSSEEKKKKKEDRQKIVLFAESYCTRFD